MAAHGRAWTQMAVDGRRWLRAAPGRGVRGNQQGRLDPAADVLYQASQWRSSGLGVALATVLATWGSSPRRPGSQLAVNERSEFLGSVSGGCVEAAVIEAALEVIRSGDCQFLSFGVSDEAAWELGLACGGRVEIYVEPVD